MSDKHATQQENKDDDAIHKTITIQLGNSVLPPTIHSTSTKKIAKYKCYCPLPIFLPFGQLILIWDAFLCIILIYSIVEIPYYLAFDIHASAYSFIIIFGAFIDTCLLFDILINFRTAYIDKYDRLRIIHDPKLIAKKYLKTWFIIDLLSALPFTYVLLVVPEKDNSPIFVFFNLIRIIKLIRIVKILKMFHVFREHFHFIPNREQKMIFTLLKTLILMLLIAHYFACFWYGIGIWAHRKNMNSWIDIIVENGDQYTSNFCHYSYALYWAIVTLFTTGYGDIHAFNMYEQWTCSIGILIGSCFFAYFISILTSGLVDDLKHQSKSERIEQCLTFCKHYNLPKEISRAIITHMRYYNSENYLFNHEIIMNVLPEYLQNQISEHLTSSVLKELDIFESLPVNIIGQIGLKLKSISVGENQFLYQAGHIGKELYIQRTGKSRIIHNGVPNTHKDRHLERGDVVGENSILSRRRQHSIQCLTWSEFYVLDIYDIVNVLKDNFDPKDARKEWNKIKNIIKNTKSDLQIYPVISEDLSYVNNINSKHRHVRFKTIAREDFPTFVAPGCQTPGLAASLSTSSRMKRKADLSTYSEEELALEMEEQERNKKKKKNRTFQSWTNIFSNMQKQTSHSRNKKVHSHYEKKAKGTTVTLAYSHVPPNDNILYDLEVDDEYLFVSPKKSKSNNENCSVRSAGFFNFSTHNNYNMMDHDDDDKKELEKNKEEKQMKSITDSGSKNDNVKYKRIVNDNKTEVIELQKYRTHSISKVNTGGNCDVAPLKQSEKENTSNTSDDDSGGGVIGEE